MKKLLQQPGKKVSKMNEQPQNHENRHENDISSGNEDIEADAVGDPLPLSHTDKQTPKYHHLSHNSNKKTDSNLSPTNIVPSTKHPPKSTNGYVLTLSTDITINVYTKSDLHTKSLLCSKHPRHDQFIPIIELNMSNFPEYFRKPCWLKLVKLKAMDVVRLAVSYTSENRPEELGFKGVKTVRHGTGTVFLYNMDKTERCDCTFIESVHSASGLFRVLTASHVVFDDEEAKNTTVEFFYDSADFSTIIKGWGVRVCLVDVTGNRSIIECRTHDVNLCQRLKDAHSKRNELLKNELQSEVRTAQMVVLISHPHGFCKQVSFGTLKERNIVGNVRRTKEGVRLVDCMLTYDTPTCPGSGGGPVNVIGGGTVSYAFAPHCASKGCGENISGLGWTIIDSG